MKRIIVIAIIMALLPFQLVLAQGGSGMKSDPSAMSPSKAYPATPVSPATPVPTLASPMPGNSGGTVFADAPQPMVKETIAVYGHGNSKCSDYMGYKTRNQETIVKNYQVWVNGFVSAYNTLMSPTGNVAKGKKSDDFVKWIENYCTQNPSAFFQRATIELLRAMEAGEF